MSRFSGYWSAKALPILSCKPNSQNLALGYCTLQSTARSRGQMLCFRIQLDVYSSASQLFIALQ